MVLYYGHTTCYSRQSISFLFLLLFFKKENHPKGALIHGRKRRTHEEGETSLKAPDEHGLLKLTAALRPQWEAAWRPDVSPSLSSVEEEEEPNRSSISKKAEEGFWINGDQTTKLEKRCVCVCA